MKNNLIIAEILLLIISNNLIAGRFDVFPLSMNFNGVVISGHHIIAYSDKGSYLMTTDRGNSWKQYNVNDYGQISYMLDYNDTLWGIIDKGIILKSIDNGLTFEKYRHTLEVDDSFVGITASDNYIFVRCQKKIIQFDKNLNFIKDYFNTKLYCPYWDEWYGDSIKAFTYIGFSENKVLVPICTNPYNGNGDLLILSEGLEEIGLIKLSDIEIISRDFSDFRGTELKNIFYYKNKPVYILKYLPFYSDENFNNWSYIYKNLKTGRNNWDIPNDWQLLHSYYITNDNIYYGKGAINLNIKSIKKDAGTGGWDIHTTGILKYNEQKDTFELVGNFFNNDYYTIGDIPYTDGISESLWLNNFVILEDSIIVWRGKNKTLLQSRDYGSSWELISYMKYSFIYPKFILNDSIFYFMAFSSNEISISTNAGSTFLPTKIDTNEFKPRFQNFYNPILFHMDTTGLGVIIGSRSGIKTSYKDLGITENYGKNFRFQETKPFFSIKFLSSLSNLSRVENDLIFSINYGDSSRIFKYNLIDNKFNFVKKDTFNAVHHFIIYDEKHIFMICTYSNKNEPDKKRLEVRETFDSGLSWNVINNINDSMNIIQVYEHNKDSVFITRIKPNRIYLYDIKRNAFDTLYSEEKDIHSYLQILYLPDKFFIVGDSLFLKNSNRKDLTQWEIGQWDYGIPNFRNVLFKGNIAIAKLSDSLRGESYYKLTLSDDVSSSIEKDVEVLKSGHFYIAPTHPIPASSTVRAKLYWDTDYDIENAFKEVYDVLGNKLGERKNIQIVNKQKYSADLVWNCSAIQTGVYFLLIDYHGEMRAIRIIISK